MYSVIVELEIIFGNLHINKTTQYKIYFSPHKLRLPSPLILKAPFRWMEIAIGASQASTFFLKRMSNPKTSAVKWIHGMCVTPCVHSLLTTTAQALIWPFNPTTVNITGTFPPGITSVFYHRHGIQENPIPD